MRVGGYDPEAPRAEDPTLDPARTFVIEADGNCYWRPDRCGYGSLLHAGLYTEAEARDQEARRPEVDRAVPLARAIDELGVERLNPEILAALVKARGGA